MKIYEVGGAVRDALLGQGNADKDWVVVGASPQEMLQAGFQPVGRDFPVFLHPVTHEEYALARTERKTAPGYRGFAFHAAPDVSLEADLARRDLTINAMARDERGLLIDPYGGQEDLRRGVLRHVSAAFAEDPVRILRIARFAARFADFTIAAETLLLMRQMVDAGEVDALVPERVWRELSRGLMERRPSRMLAVLHDCGALARLCPDLTAGGSGPLDAASRAIDRAAQLDAPLSVRFACLAYPHGGVREAPRCLGLRAPTDCVQLAELLAREHRQLASTTGNDADALMHLLECCDALRQPQRFEALLQACEITAQVQQASELPALDHLRRALAAVLALPTAALAATAAAKGLQGPDIGAAIRLARVAAIGAALNPEAPLRSS